MFPTYPYIFIQSVPNQIKENTPFKIDTSNLHEYKNITLPKIAHNSEQRTPPSFTMLPTYSYIFVQSIPNQIKENTPFKIHTSNLHKNKNISLTKIAHNSVQRTTPWLPMLPTYSYIFIQSIPNQIKENTPLKINTYNLHKNKNITLPEIAHNSVQRTPPWHINNTDLNIELTKYLKKIDASRYLYWKF